MKLRDLLVGIALNICWNV